jgi:ankyrin repeat protein
MAMARAKNAVGQTALMAAVWDGNEDLIRLLVEKGYADLEARDASLNGKTPLMSAAYSKNANLVMYLLSQKANVNARKDDGWAVLSIAIEGGSPDVVKLLVENGADLTVKTPKGLSVVQLAEGWYQQSRGESNYRAIADYLRSKGAK